MGHRLAVLVAALALVPLLALAATQGPPAYVYTGTAPSGACVGTRVWIDALGTGTYYCNAGTWAAVSSASIPDATPTVTGGIKLTGDLGGTAASPTVPGLATKAASVHAHAAGDVTSGTLAGARGGGGAALPTCLATEKLTSNGTSWSCATDLNSGGSGGGRYTAVLLDFGATESDDVASTTVTGQTWVTANSRIMCAPTMHATSSRAEGAEDAVVEGLTVAVHSRVVGTGFTVTAAAREGTTGVYQVVCSGSDDWSTLVASIAPATEGCGCTGVGTCGCNTGYATCSATGGTGAYTYSWTVDDGTVSISNSTSATSRFGATGAIPGSISPTATCTVSDGISTAAKALPLTITFDSI